MRRSQVEFIDPSNRRVFGEAAALLWCLDQPLHTVFGPLPSGGGCKVSLVRREGFVPAAIPGQQRLIFISRSFPGYKLIFLQDLSATGVCRFSVSDISVFSF